MTSIELIGLDGGNPLAFLTALGVVVTLNDVPSEHEVRLSWAVRDAWRPVLSCRAQRTADELVEALDTELRQQGDAPFRILENASDDTIADNLTMGGNAYRRYASAAIQSGVTRASDFAAVFACDVLETKGQVLDTAFRMLSGAGHQDFLKSMRDLLTSTSRDQVREAVFGPWQYRDGPPIMRWDPDDDRRYALRWKEPSGDPIRTVRGANRLAIEGLRLLPSVPVDSRLRTVGFRGDRASDAFWTWPIWTTPLNVDVIRSLLALEALQADELEPAQRAALYRIGVAEIFRVQRLTVAKHRGFAPAAPL
jgi:hypothetical protein